VSDAADQHSVERLYREDGDRLWRAVFAWSGDRGIADDAVSEAFTQALKRAGELRDPLAWIWRVAFRVAAGELKERRRRGIGSTVPDDGYEMPESAGEVFAALGGLSPHQRAAVVLHHYAGYPVKEIAAIIGSTTPAVKVHLSAGRKRLREALEAQEDD
jgi:RNA polymerase sigma-70 factor, ECF subfamily